MHPLVQVHVCRMVTHAVRLGQHVEDVLPAADSLLDALRVEQVDAARDAVRMREALHLENVLGERLEAVAAVPASVREDALAALRVAVDALGLVPDVGACAPARQADVPFEAGKQTQVSLRLSRTDRIGLGAYLYK